ncbi:disease resistance protein RPV1-like isoform X2 [Nymphaea colorata]|uniref:disease resistance protein RPV1-like isoform X2 n=1 Tax=Nymphaea colorata TaxID=210225 RepID=UPI00129ED949|nr:disease resistance protein RPV1-like isoform X2 [Nymphaea colorata]
MKRSSLPRYSDQSDYEDDEAAPSPSSPPPVGEDDFQYDVFLSFRGPDTRNGFTGHLHHAMQDKGIHTFIDSQELEKGQKVKELFRYIETSKIFVPIFSKGYADSEWCLKEITKMVECKRLIIPVFFDVEPRDVRGQSGPFEPAFTRYGKNDITNKEEVRKWRNALTEVGEVSGYTLANGCVDEATEIKKIVTRILTEVNNAPLFIGDTHLIGLDSRIAELVEVLELESQNDVKMVGIHGMGGIGKTTLVRAVYNQLFLHFDACSFISDVREAAKQSKLVSLQEQLLRDVLKVENVKVNNKDHGTSMIMHRIKHKKVLLVLDDVDSESQLEALVGSVDQFCHGSRIIITTRDMQVLIEPPTLRVKDVYEIKELDSAQSLQLFSWHAFGKEEPPAEFAKLSKEVAATVAGLPLALKIFGRHFLCQKTNKLGEDMLKKLKKDQHKDIHERLKISFDALEKEEKSIFLDIACFFIGQKRSFATFMWKERYFHPDLTIEVLIHKCLVNINEHTGVFEMHDHIRDMGRKIVEDESPNPENRSRLWQKDDILKVLREKKGTEKIEAINLSCERDYPTLCVNAKSFAGMSQLKMLQLWNVRLKGKYRDFPRTLRWLRWNSQDLGRLPSKLSLENIVVLDLCWCYNMHQVWRRKRFGSTKVFSQLKVLSLRHCRRLTVCPDFTGMPRIEELNFEGCWALTELHPSIWRLTSLQVLDLRYCFKIIALPSQPSDSKSLKQPLLGRLKVLNLSFCKNLTTCPDFSFVPYIEELDFTRCEKLTELHPSIWNLKRLTRLSLRDCISLEEGFEQVWQLTSLEKLDLSDCNRITSPSRDSRSLNQLLGKLKILHLSYCGNLTLCPNFTGMAHLEKLDVEGCWNLKELDPSIGHLKRLTHLSLEGCISLKELPVEVWQLTSLEELKLTCCSQNIALPSQLKRPMLGKLKALYLFDCPNLTISPNFTSMPHLKKLHFEGCVKLIRLCPSIGHLRSLTHLSLKKCESLKELPKEVWQLTSLEELDLSMCYGISALPSQSKQPMLGKLKVMRLSSCKNLTICPDLTCMPHVEKLDFRHCEKLTELHPSIGHLKSLHHLNLGGCGSLNELPKDAWQSTSLEHLDLRYCCKVATLPSQLGNSGRLKQLLLDGTVITALPESMRQLEQLKHLSLNNCYLLKEIPEWILSCISLEKLEAAKCLRLASLPNALGNLKSLRYLSLSGTAIEELPSSIHSLTQLTHLSIVGCKRLKFLPQLPRSIRSVYAADCCEMEEIADVSEAINLWVLDLTGCQKLVDVPGVEQLRGLRKLKLGGCRSLSDSFKRRVQEADFPSLVEELTIPGSMEESSDARSHSSSWHMGSLSWAGSPPWGGGSKSMLGRKLYFWN